MSASPYKAEEDPCFLLWRQALDRAGAKRVDGHSLHLRVKKGDAEIDFNTEPPQTTQVYRRDSNQQRSTTKAEAENALKGYEEFILVEETADKIVVKKRKGIPDPQWKTLGPILSSNGFKWSSNVSAWEANKK
jgi:hypothetical protein